MTEMHYRPNLFEGALCDTCKQPMRKGEIIAHNRRTRRAYHAKPACSGEEIPEVYRRMYGMTPASDKVPETTETPDSPASPTSPASDKPEVTGTLEKAIVDAIWPAFSERLKSATSLDDVEALIDAKLEEIQKIVTVEVKTDEGTHKVEGLTHEKFPLLLKLMSMKRNVFLHGPAGTGKSHAAIQAAEALKLRWALISLTPQTSDTRLTGYMSADGKYIRTPFREMFEHGGVFIIDEIDNASGNLLTSLNSATANGYGSFPDAVVRRHEDFRLVVTGNTPGLGGTPQYPDRRVLDAATRSRYIFIEWDYDYALEGAIAKNPTWLAWVKSVRQYVKANSLRVDVSPRSTFDGSTLLREMPDLSIAEVAEMTVFKGIPLDTRNKILTACPLPKARN